MAEHPKMIEFLPIGEGSTNDYYGEVFSTSPKETLVHEPYIRKLTKTSTKTYKKFRKRDGEPFRFAYRAKLGAMALVAWQDQDPFDEEGILRLRDKKPLESNKISLCVILNGDNAGKLVWTSNVSSRPTKYRGEINPSIVETAIQFAKESGLLPEDFKFDVKKPQSSDVELA